MINKKVHTARNVEIKLLPDWATMKSCTIENGEITSIEFRSAEEIERLMSVRSESDDYTGMFQLVES